MKFKSLAVLLIALAFGQGIFGQASYRYEIPDYTFPTSFTEFGSNILSTGAFSIATSDEGMLFGTKSLEAGQQSLECILTKTDLQGNVQWATRLFDSNNPNHTLSPQHAVELPTQGYYVLGYYEENPSATIPRSGFVAFVDLSGNMQWVRLLSLNGVPGSYQALRKGILAQNGDLIAAGIEHDPGVTSGHVVAFDASGNQSFSEIHTSSPGASVRFSDIESTEPGECIVLGGGGQEVFLIHRTNDCQTMDWHTSLDIPLSNGYVIPQSVAYHPPTGGYFVTGNLNIGTTKKGFLAYADKQGTFQWVWQLAGPLGHLVSKDIVCEGEYAYIVGSAYNTNGTKQTKGFIAKFDEHAALFWSKRFIPQGFTNERLFLNSIELWIDPQNPGNTVFFQIGGLAKQQWNAPYNNIAAHLTYIDSYDDECAVENLNLSLLGQSWSQASWPITISSITDLNNFALDQKPVDDYQNDHCGALKTRPFEAPEALTGEWKVFPNPTTNTLQVRIPKDELPAAVTLTDLQGRIVRAYQQSEVQAEADLRGLPAGMYILNASGTTTPFSQRITIQK